MPTVPQRQIRVLKTQTLSGLRRPKPRWPVRPKKRTYRLPTLGMPSMPWSPRAYAPAQRHRLWMNRPLP